MEAVECPGATTITTYYNVFPPTPPPILTWLDSACSFERLKLSNHPRPRLFLLLYYTPPTLPLLYGTLEMGGGGDISQVCFSRFRALFVW